MDEVALVSHYEMRKNCARSHTTRCVNCCSSGSMCKWTTHSHGIIFSGCMLFTMSRSVQEQAFRLAIVILFLKKYNNDIIMFCRFFFFLEKFSAFFLGGAASKTYPNPGYLSAQSWSEQVDLHRVEKRMSVCAHGCHHSVYKERERSRRDIIVAKSVIVHNCTQPYLRLSWNMSWMPDPWGRPESWQSTYTHARGSPNRAKESIKV